MKKLDITGEKYNRLTAISFNEKTNKWLCKCDCGTIKEIKLDKLRGGKTKSCGCLNNEARIAKAHKLYSACIKYEPHIASAVKTWRRRYSDGLSFEDFMYISQMNCFYCGKSPANIANSHKHDKKAAKQTVANGNFIYNGLDRMDSAKNHNINNVVPCCWRCNSAKSNKSLDEFMQWAQKVNNYICKK
jgi:5-methylcytosine-specific restriction endonuclease McrA